jgi:hypothetical protein
MAEHVYLIDVENEKYEPVKWMPRGHGFEIELGHYPDRGRRIRYDDEIIGQYWCRKVASTAPGHFAVAFGPVGSNLGYPTGIAVWSDASRQWSDIEIDFLYAIVGWTSW